MSLNSLFKGIRYRGTARCSWCGKETSELYDVGGTRLVCERCYYEITRSSR